MITLIVVIALEAIIIIGLTIFTNIVISQRKELDSTCDALDLKCHYAESKLQVYKQATERIISEISKHSKKTNVFIAEDTIGFIGNELNRIKNEHI